MSKSLDLNNKEQLIEMMKDGDAEAMAEAMQMIADKNAEKVRNECLTSMNAKVDSAVLAQRGVRQLTAEEKAYYEEVINASKSSNFKMALTGIEKAMPETIVNAVFEDIRKAHPLISAIDFVATTGAVKFIINKTGIKLAAWGALNSTITNELTGGIDVIDCTAGKLTAFIPVDKSMLDLGPEWLDTYVRAVLEESIYEGLEDGIINGDGKNQPIGMTMDINAGASSSTGQYSAQTPASVTSLDAKTIGTLLGAMAVNGNSGRTRAVENVILVCNPADYYSKVVPAMRVLTTGGQYVDALPFAINIVQSNQMAAGSAVLGLAKQYKLFAASANGGKLEYDDSVNFFADQRVYASRFYAYGMPTDKNAFRLLDISSLTTAYVTVKEVQ